MGSTNKTPYLGLAQFINTDKPSWRGDVNDDNARVDAAIRGSGVEIEQFPGASDDIKFNNALAAIAPGGGKIRLRPGKVYNFVNPINTFDFSEFGTLIIIEAWGAIVNCNVPGAAWTLKKTTTGAAINTIVVLGGEWNNTHVDATEFFLLLDVGRSLWFRVRGNCPPGSAWHQQNFAAGGFSENNHYIEIYDPGSKHCIRFSRSLASLHGSMARTVMRGINVQGGMANEPKIFIDETNGLLPALYSSLLDGFTGNLATDAIGIRIAGNNHGLQITGNIGLENSIGVTGVDFSYYFIVGELSGGPRAVLKTDIPDELTMHLIHPDSLQPTLYGAVKIPAGVLGVGDVTKFSMLNGDPHIALPATDETEVWSIDVEPGEYLLDGSMCINIPVANTSTDIQVHVNGGTADYQVFSCGAEEANIAANANAAKQTRTMRVTPYLVVNVAGTVLVSARAGANAEIVPTTPLSGFSRATGYTLHKVA